MKDLKDNLKDKNVLLFLAYSCFFNMVFEYVVFSLYLISKGISTKNLALYFTIYSITQAIFEVPTGYFADKYKRKYSISIGLFISAIGYFLLTFTDSLYLILVISGLLALGNSFRSGASDSLFYDYLKDKNQEKLYPKINGYIYAATLLTGILASLGGAYLYDINREIPFYLTAAMYLISGIIILYFNERGVFHSPEKTLKQGLLNLMGKKIRYLIFLEILATPFIVIFYNVYNYPKLEVLGFSSSSIGIFDATISALLAVIMATIIHKIIKIKFIKEIFTFLPIALFLIYTKLDNLTLCLIISFITSIGFSLRYQTIQNHLHERLDSSLRATTLSALNFFSMIVAGVSINLIVFIIERFNN